MAFKNLLDPNPASGSDLKKNVTGYGTNRNTPTRDVINTYKQHSSVKLTSTSLYTYNLYIYYNKPLTANTKYAVYAPTIAFSTSTPKMIAYFYDSGGANVGSWSGTGKTAQTWTEFIETFTTPPNIVSGHIALSCDLNTGESFNVGASQLEQNDHFTGWQFPGVDLTGNTIPSMEQVNNLSLESLLKLDSIQPTSQINDLIIQNTLQLLGIPSTEQVNNIKLLNQIILDAVESTESVNDLIIYVLREMAIYNVTINRKEEYNTILNRKEEYEVKV